MKPDNFIQAKIATMLSGSMNWLSIKDHPMMNIQESVFIYLRVIKSVAAI